MQGKRRSVLLLIYTPEFLISGYAKVKQVKIGDSKVYSRRVSDIIAAASERMSYAGEPEFLELTKADIQDLRTKETLAAKLRSVVVRKSAIRLIIPGGKVHEV
jgi:hypothetical protein